MLGLAKQFVTLIYGCVKQSKNNDQKKEHLLFLAISEKQLSGLDLAQTAACSYGGAAPAEAGVRARERASFSSSTGSSGLSHTVSTLARAFPTAWRPRTSYVAAQGPKLSIFKRMSLEEAVSLFVTALEDDMCHNYHTVLV